MAEKTIKEQLDEARLEKEQLELIMLRDQVAAIKAKVDKQRVSHAQVESSIADFAHQQKMRQDGCSHRKGGMDYDGLVRGGNDPMYCVIKHQMPDNEIIVLCTRCQRLWRKKDKDYQEGIRLNTDNTLSGSCQFSFTPYGPSSHIDA